MGRRSRERQSNSAVTAVVVRDVTTPAADLLDIGRAREELQDRERVAVAAARCQGMTWQAIADALALPVATVHRRYRSVPGVR